MMRFISLGRFSIITMLANRYEPKAHKLNTFTRKRIRGRLDSERLNNALALLVQKHEVLSYYPARFRLGQL